MAKLPSITERYGDVDFRQTGPLFTKENYAQFKSNYVKLKKATAPFDRYERKSKAGTLVLGQGNFGTGALARDTRTRKKVASKSAKMQPADIALHEGLVLDKARHKNIIEVYDVITALKTK